MQLGSTAIAVRTDEGVVMAVEKRVTSPLLVRLAAIAAGTGAGSVLEKHVALLHCAGVVFSEYDVDRPLHFCIRASWHTRR